jgi:hypothetical protein
MELDQDWISGIGFGDELDSVTPITGVAGRTGDSHKLDSVTPTSITGVAGRTGDSHRSPQDLPHWWYVSGSEGDQNRRPSIGNATTEPETTGNRHKQLQLQECRNRNRLTVNRRRLQRGIDRKVNRTGESRTNSGRGDRHQCAGTEAGDLLKHRSQASMEPKEPKNQPVGT